MRARADQREIALEGNIEQLRQFVERKLADDAPDPCHARVVSRDLPRAVGVEPVDIHRTELVDLDLFVVEAVTNLLEQHGAARVELHRQSDERQQRRQDNDDASPASRRSSIDFSATFQSDIGLSNTGRNGTSPI